jgi:protoheme IX farnesyltransferase
MLPVVASEVTVARQSVLYAWAMVAVSLLLAPATGVIYLATAVLAGGAFLVEAHRLLGRARRAREGQNVRLAPMRLFHLSITYLTLLFTAVAVDPFLRIPLF